MRNRRQRKQPSVLGVLAMIAAALLLIICIFDRPAPEIPDSTEPTQTHPSTTLQTEPPAMLPEPYQALSTATLGAMGDLLMHKPIFSGNSAVAQSDGSYDFSSVFRYLADYTSSLDYAVANLETTLCGLDNGYAYSGYPNFNCPDALIDGVKNAGFDMMLTANNHSYDTQLKGYLRTLDVVRSSGLETLGTYASADEQKWTVVNINGIRVGMLCYTWASYVSEGRPSLNGNAPIAKTGLCNYFHSSDLPGFYAEVKQYLSEMSAAGAEASVMYIHWGVEYKLQANQEQKAIAQALCDLGIDVIVGGHPHVVQPIDLLESATDPNHKTVCLYSTGNAVSNQRQGNLSAIKTAHTEDGILFTFSFEKYSDGDVYLSDVDAIPTWVNMHTKNGAKEYNILPLDYDREAEWATMFDIDESTTRAAADSYDRTMAIIGEGLKEVQTWLSLETAARANS